MKTFANRSSKIPPCRKITPVLKLSPNSTKNIGSTSNLATTERNMKFKLEQLDDKLQELFTSVRGTREECRELLDQTSFLKNSLVYEDLFGLKQQMDGLIAGLSKQIRQTKDANMDRYNLARQNCGVLWQSTEQLKENVFQLSMRVQKLQLKLGYREGYRL